MASPNDTIEKQLSNIRMQQALLVFPYDHECNPTRLLEVIAHGEQILYCRSTGAWTEKHTFESASGILFVIPHDDNGLIMNLAHLVLNAMHERGYGMFRPEENKAHFWIGAPELFPEEVPYLVGIDYV